MAGDNDQDVTPQGGGADDGGGSDVREPEHREEPKAWEPDDNAKRWLQEQMGSAQKQWEEQHLTPAKKQYEDLVNRMTQAEVQRLKAMGWIKDEPEKPLTRAELQEMLKKEREEQAQTYREQNYRSIINSGWRGVSKTYPDLAKMQSFQRAVLAAYAEDPKQDFADVADAVAKDFEAYHGVKSKAAQEEQKRRMEPHRRMVPSGRGAAGGDRAPQEGERKSVGQKLLARLQASRAG